VKGELFGKCAHFVLKDLNRRTLLLEYRDNKWTRRGGFEPQDEVPVNGTRNWKSSAQNPTCIRGQYCKRHGNGERGASGKNNVTTVPKKAARKKEVLYVV